MCIRDSHVRFRRAQCDETLFNLLEASRAPAEKDGDAFSKPCHHRSHIRAAPPAPCAAAAAQNPRSSAPAA
eukprot:7038515-Prymnesium_polylepis.1